MNIFLYIKMTKTKSEKEKINLKEGRLWKDKRYNMIIVLMQKQSRKSEEMVLKFFQKFFYIRPTLKTNPILQPKEINSVSLPRANVPYLAKRSIKNFVSEEVSSITLAGSKNPAEPL